MSTQIINGFVINSIDYEEFAQIITVFSFEQGKISFYAPGVRKITSKNKYAVQLFTKSTFEIFKSRRKDSLSKLKTGNIEIQFANISKNFLTYVYVQNVAEIINQLSEDYLPDIETFNLLELFLNNENNDNKTFSTYIFALFYLLKISGNQLNVSKCVRCGFKKNWYRRFDYKNRGLICINCFLPHEKKQSKSFVIMIQKMGELTFNEILNYDFNIVDLIAFHNFLIDYYESDIGISVPGFNQLKNTASTKVPDNMIDDYI